MPLILEEVRFRLRLTDAQRAGLDAGAFFSQLLKVPGVEEAEFSRYAELTIVGRLDPGAQSTQIAIGNIQGRLERVLAAYGLDV